ncbi:hypothetical protein ABW19_dt0200506 [Dactylella cylindrospora]|nr:hypothetical protein ABW19_dt0200506 [Dactylella cylindrospora]
MYNSLIVQARLGCLKPMREPDTIIRFLQMFENITYLRIDSLVCFEFGGATTIVYLLQQAIIHLPNLKSIDVHCLPEALAPYGDPLPGKATPLPHTRLEKINIYTCIVDHSREWYIMCKAMDRLMGRLFESAAAATPPGGWKWGDLHTISIIANVKSYWQSMIAAPKSVKLSQKAMESTEATEVGILCKSMESQAHELVSLASRFPKLKSLALQICGTKAILNDPKIQKCTIELAIKVRTFRELVWHWGPSDEYCIWTIGREEGRAPEIQDEGWFAPMD